MFFVPLDEKNGDWPTIVIVTHHGRKFKSLNEKVLESFMSKANSSALVEAGTIKWRNHDSLQIHTFENVSNSEVALQISKHRTEFMRKGSSLNEAIAKYLKENRKSSEQGCFARASI